MKILQWIRSLRQSKRVAIEPSEAPVRVQRMVVPPGGIEPDNVEGEDEMMREMIARCWNTGKMVIANRDSEGNVTMSEHEIERPNDQDQP